MSTKNAPNGRRTFQIVLSLFVPILLAIGMETTSSQVHAQGLATLQCVGGHSATWTPGVTNTLETVTVSTQSNWTCVNALDPLNILANASSTNTFQVQFDCQSLLSMTSPPITWTIQWNNGDTSTYTFTPAVTDEDGNLVVAAANGSITGGRFKGAAVVGTYILPGLAAVVQNGCIKGVTSATGTSTLTIVGVPL